MNTQNYISNELCHFVGYGCVDNKDQQYAVMSSILRDCLIIPGGHQGIIKNNTKEYGVKRSTISTKLREIVVMDEWGIIDFLEMRKKINHCSLSSEEKDCISACLKEFCDWKNQTTLRNLRIDFQESVSSNERYLPSIVCFCDIPRSDLPFHMKRYGSFGLSFNKEFFVSKGGSPVFYIPKKAETIIETSQKERELPHSTVPKPLPGGFNKLEKEDYFNLFEGGDGHFKWLDNIKDIINRKLAEIISVFPDNKQKTISEWIDENKFLEDTSLLHDMSPRFREQNIGEHDTTSWRELMGFLEQGLLYHLKSFKDLYHWHVMSMVKFFDHTLSEHRRTVKEIIGDSRWNLTFSKQQDIYMLFEERNLIDKQGYLINKDFHGDSYNEIFTGISEIDPTLAIHNFSNFYCALKSNDVNFYYEREWRIVGALHFTMEDIQCVYLPKKYYAGRFRKDFSDYCGEVIFTE